MKPKRTLPPAGAPIYVKDLISGIGGMVRPAKALKKFECELRSYFGVKHVFLVSSGKAALTLILEALSHITNKDEVVIPSYTCFSVPSAVVRAGLKPVICDIEQDSFEYDIRSLDRVVGKKTLCVIVTHLFGIPCDLKSTLSVARSVGSCVVEDCAQAMGVELGGKRVGTIGDVGFFSLGRGKSLCAVSGGIIITNTDRIAEVLSKKVSELKTPGMMEQLSIFCVATFLHIFSRPSLYWFPSGLPFLNIGKTIFSTDFPVEKLAGFNAGLAADWESKLETLNDVRRQRAGAYREALKDDGFLLVREPVGSRPAYLRFPLVADSPAKREKVCGKLMACGLGASSNYPTGIADITELNFSDEQKARGRVGHSLAQRILTLPTHCYVSDHDMEEICKSVTNWT